MRFSLHDEAHIPLCPIYLGWLARRRACPRKPSLISSVTA